MSLGVETVGDGLQGLTPPAQVRGALLEVDIQRGPSQGYSLRPCCRQSLFGPPANALPLHLGQGNQEGQGFVAKLPSAHVPPLITAQQANALGTGPFH